MVFRRSGKLAGALRASTGAILVLCLGYAIQVAAQPGKQPAEIHVAVNKSQIISSPTRFAEISVGNPEIADVIPLSRSRFYILGKEIGSTNIILTGDNNSIIDIIDVVVGFDVQSLKRAIHDVSPGSEVEVRTAGAGLVLSGTVDTADKAGNIAALADAYAPGRVNNMLSVSGSQQVLLNVRFAEVQRSALKDLGVNIDATFFSNDDIFFFSTGQGINPETFGVAGALLGNDDYALDALVDALEENGMVRTLAEPNLVALSGDTASFLAGGEFPIPVAQESDSGATTITVEFKEFGVGLAFTPTVLGKDAINLEVDSEVSSIDPSVSVTSNLITIPGLKVRRARTTVELLDGQSFAIAGLIQDDFESAVRAVPGLGSVPILGALFRSNSFQRRQTELVLIITVHLVRPTTADRLAAPTDYFLPPQEQEFFLFGTPEDLSTMRGAAGIDGQFGYESP